MQIPILEGIYTDSKSDFRSEYPRNLVPVPMRSGIAQSYLRPAEGVTQLGTGPGVDRGGINWNDRLYRVMGSKIVRINEDWSVDELGDVSGTNSQVSMTYSFDNLAISADGKMYLVDRADSVSQVTDTDLGVSVDVEWVDGYFMSTDGEFLIVTDLGAPSTVNPLKYGSNELDPDPINALLRLRKEIYALNRYTIEVMSNIGGTGFPFSRINSAAMNRGCIGTHCCAVFDDAIAFLGSGRNESLSIWLGVNGQTAKLATREVDQILETYALSELEKVVFETRSDMGHHQLWVRLPDQTLVYDGGTSKILGVPIWFRLTTSLVGKGQHQIQNLVRCYGETVVGHPSQPQFGKLSDSVASHWGTEVGWELATPIVYNEGRGAIFHSLELVGLTGRAAFGDNPTIWTQYSIDGVNWSVERGISAGKQGDRMKRLVWFNQGPMRHWRIQRFRGTSESRLSITALEAMLEPLNV